ncbi:MAG TPA: FAD-dependent oxidoreductase [Nanoarchaeota archaeon]|nr:FAD-dependent oxidoreductase [Nanoarchaeota archaeon]
MKTVAVLGAGITGLAAAWKLSEAGYNVHIIEKEDKTGGMSSSIRLYDSVLDLGPHKIYSKLPVLQGVKLLLKDDLQVIPKYSRIRLFGKYFEYPLKLAELALNVSPVITVGIGTSYVLAAARNKLLKPEDKNYESYMVNRFGYKLYNYVFKSYAEKAWDTPSNLDASLAKSRIALPSLYEVIKGMLLGGKKGKELHAEQFYYPSKGIALFSKRMLEKSESHGGKLHLNAKIEKISLKHNKAVSITFRSGKNQKVTIQADYIVSTIPMRALASLLPDTPKSVVAGVNSLKCRSLALLYLNVRKDRLFKDNWIFFPEKKYIFNRISEQKGFSEHTVPEGSTVLCVEVTSPEKEKYTDTELFGLVVTQLEECGILTKAQIAGHKFVNIENAYPIYRIGYKDEIMKFLEYLDNYQNMLSIGRQGLFNYVGMIDCVDMGFKAANFVKAGKGMSEWKKIREGFFNYITVD